MMRKAVIALAATALAASPAAMAASVHGSGGGSTGFGGGHSMNMGGYAVRAGGGQSIGVGGGSMNLGVSRATSGAWSHRLGTTGAAVLRSHTFAPSQIYSGTRGIYRAQSSYGSRSANYVRLGNTKYAYGYGKDHDHHHHHHRHGVIIVGGPYVDYGDDFGWYDSSEYDSCWQPVRTNYGWQRVWVCGDSGNY